MLWNVFLIEDGECSRFNSEPYDAAEIGMVLNMLNGQTVILVPESAVEFDAERCSELPH